MPIESTNDIYVVVTELAANYLRGCTTDDVSKTRLAVSVQHAALCGRLLHCAEDYLRGPQDAGSVEALSENLLKAKFPSSSIPQCVKILQKVKEDLQKNSAYHYQHTPMLKQLHWRVDITISSSTLSRVLEPLIVMEVVKNDDQKVTFEVSISKFHQLRYTVASILKEMDMMGQKMSAIKL